MYPAESGELGIICTPGAVDLCQEMDDYLKQWRGAEDTFIIGSSYPRFKTGDGKVVLLESVRGRDIFIISDPYNCSIEYKIRSRTTCMSPDDHFQDIKRVISAINGRACRISVMMPMLYASRQHDRKNRESLDCASSLIELERIGVKNIITFDAHDPKVQNAVPLVSFDNLYPSYQMLKALVHKHPDITLDESKLVVVASDAGGVSRCLKFAEALHLEIGMFYKRRDTQTVVDGKNEIMVHEFFGRDLNGRDVIVIDDMIGTGDSLLDSFRELKKRGARKVIAFISFGIFSAGYARFDDYYAQGLFDEIFITNLSYRDEELLTKPWFANVDLSKYAAYIIDSINKGVSVSKAIDPDAKIRCLKQSLAERRLPPDEG